MLKQNWHWINPAPGSSKITKLWLSWPSIYSQELPDLYYQGSFNLESSGKPCRHLCQQKKYKRRELKVKLILYVRSPSHCEAIPSPWQSSFFLVIARRHRRRAISLFFSHCEATSSPWQSHPLRVFFLQVITIKKESALLKTHFLQTVTKVTITYRS